jgi:hypothetical protein
MALPIMESLAVSKPVISLESPRRMSVFYFPNGLRMEQFRPASAGSDYAVTPILEPIDHLRESFSVFTGLAHYNAQPLGDAGGDHGRSCAAFLTGAHARPTEGADLQCAISMDQVVAAQHVGITPFPSLELGIEPSSLLGSCAPGYSCTYSNTLSWQSTTQALPVIANPQDVFDRLFGGGTTTDPAQRLAQQQQRRSILDYLREDAARLSRQLGSDDRRKMGEYLESVRAVERRIQAMAGRDFNPDADALQLPVGLPADFEEHVRIMLDLQILALSSDLTRVSTFMLGRELSNRAYPEIGVPDAHHSLSHHGDNSEKIEKLVRINRFHMKQLAWYLQRLADTADGEGSLLDTTVVLAGASLGEPNKHDCMDLPALVAGGGAIGGRHVALPTHTPLCNLMLSLIHSMGHSQPKFGDSNAVIPGVFA